MMNPSTFENNQELKRLTKIVERYTLCDHCIARLCTHRHDNETFKEAGYRFRSQTTTISETKVEDCYLCNGLFNELDDFYILAEESIKEYEFQSFLIGCHIDEEIARKEKQLIEDFALTDTVSVKQEINEYVGIRIEENMDKTVDFNHPDIMIIINTQFNVVTLQIKSLFLYGRYTKWKRGIPQTKWFCRRCHGKGCRYCEYSGKLYENSVEELIALPVVKATEAADESFHGAGREDIDVRMLGTGRPFVLEVKQPKKRNIDLKEIKKQITQESKKEVMANTLSYTDSSDIARIKQAHFNKVYELRMQMTTPIQKEKLKKVALSLQGTTINQLTPTRVAKRRAEKVRQRQIYHCEVLDVGRTCAVLQIEAESGTYIKELVTGDNGRTQPNLSDLLKQTCVVDSLDVIEIKGE